MTFFWIEPPHWTSFRRYQQGPLVYSVTLSVFFSGTGADVPPSGIFFFSSHVISQVNPAFRGSPFVSSPPFFFFVLDDIAGLCL